MEEISIKISHSDIFLLMFIIAVIKLLVFTIFWYNFKIY